MTHYNYNDNDNIYSILILTNYFIIAELSEDWITCLIFFRNFMASGYGVLLRAAVQMQRQTDHRNKATNI